MGQSATQNLRGCWPKAPAQKKTKTKKCPLPPKKRRKKAPAAQSQWLKSSDGVLIPASTRANRATGMTKSRHYRHHEGSSSTRCSTIFSFKVQANNRNSTPTKASRTKRCLSHTQRYRPDVFFTWNFLRPNICPIWKHSAKNLIRMQANAGEKS